MEACHAVQREVSNVLDKLEKLSQNELGFKMADAIVEIETALKEVRANQENGQDCISPAQTLLLLKVHFIDTPCIPLSSIFIHYGAPCICYRDTALYSLT